MIAGYCLILVFTRPRYTLVLVLKDLKDLGLRIRVISVSTELLRRTFTLFPGAKLSLYQVASGREHEAHKSRLSHGDAGSLICQDVVSLGYFWINWWRLVLYMCSMF